ncbi:hypothetical protein ACE1CA_23855 [Aerosakkonemataceae cyanobacterium BLCC-F167]|uniref:Uncharacterized protein n=1 Tax=Floridaenema evergladense BLCC-F167 TaxID=3153639 RepID=A0ABV4WR69_9CYAN
MAAPILFQLSDEQREQLLCIAKFLLRHKEPNLSDKESELLEKYSDLVQQIKGSGSTN